MQNVIYSMLDRRVMTGIVSRLWLLLFFTPWRARAQDCVNGCPSTYVECVPPCAGSWGQFVAGCPVGSLQWSSACVYCVVGCAPCNYSQLSGLAACYGIIYYWSFNMCCVDPNCCP